MANTRSISFYDHISYTNSAKTIPTDIFFENIRDGKWKEEVGRVRAGQLEKMQLPSVTLSGKFTSRYDDKIDQHSGLIGIDVDEDGFPKGMDATEFKSLICPDKYVQSCFITASGKGLCIVFKVHGAAHRKAFQGICEYLFNSYGIICDPTSINESRARFVSYDPYIYIKDNEADRFTQYPKDKPPKKIDKIIYAKNDFEEIINQVISRRLNLTQDSYFRYLRIGFGLVHQFGEAGRQYFHMLCQYSSKYDSAKADKQYNACIRHKSTNETTISTLYYYCKQDGISLYTERTRKIAYTTSAGKKSGLSPEAIAENLAKYEEIYEAEDVIKQVYDNNIHLDDDTLIDQVEMFIRQNYELRRNVITRYIENGGVTLELRSMNSIYIKCKKVFNNLNFDLFDRIINSEFVEDYNPFFEFFEEHKSRKITTGNIEKLFGSIKNVDPDYCIYFGRKWIVSIIASIFGDTSPLVYVLCGDIQGTGKTQFFKRLLPKQLAKYYAKSKLDAGKDDHILMTQKLIVMDDEMGGKSKKESKMLKNLTSSDIFSLREPYGRHNVDLIRLAVLCGTTNDYEILSDSTGNRRIIPVKVQSINFAEGNSVDRIDLFLEAYRLFKDGFDWEVLGDDIKYLRQDEGLFEVKNIEGELIQKYLRVPEKLQGFDTMSSTEIKVYLEFKTQQRLSLNIIGKELQRLGFKQKHKRLTTSTMRVYEVVKIEQLGNEIINQTINNEEENPF